LNNVSASNPVTSTLGLEYFFLRTDKDCNNTSKNEKEKKDG